MNWELIGKLGGSADVKKTPVEAVADGSIGSEVIMHTVHVPEGETWLVALAGDLDPQLTNAFGPEISVGEVTVGPNLLAGHASIAAEVTGTAEISLKRNTSGSPDTFSGHIYTVPLSA